MLDIKRFETMAKLSLPDGERELLAKRAGELLGSFDALARIDTAGALPLVTVLDIQNILREDVSSQVISRDELLKNAPGEYDGYFQVPKTLE